MVLQTRPHCQCVPDSWDGPGWMCAACEDADHEATHGLRDEDFEAMLDGSATLDREEALRRMGEDDDSLMLGGCGGGERDPDLEWF